MTFVATINGKQVMRPYTPIECRPEGSEFDCLIKIYAEGAMTQYVDKLEISSDLDIRGVFSDVTYSPNQLSIPGFVLEQPVSNISMIAGGTGITPCYQIIKAALSNPKDKTMINLIYSNSTSDDILLKDELIELAKDSGGRFKIHFTLTRAKENLPDGWSGRRVDKMMVQDHFEAPTTHNARNYVLICGPPGMNDTSK